MTILYTVGHPMLPPNVLTVPSEAVRGLTCVNLNWFVYVSDPEPMAVSKFQLSKETLKLAAEATKGDEIPLPEESEAVLEWLCRQKFIRGTLVKSDAFPATFGKFKTAGPSSNPRMQPPSIER